MSNETSKDLAFAIKSKLSQLERHDESKKGREFKDPVSLRVGAHTKKEDVSLYAKGWSDWELNPVNSQCSATVCINDVTQ
jgi:hypothetical protein